MKNSTESKEMTFFAHSAELRWFSPLIEREAEFLAWFHQADTLTLVKEGEVAPSVPYVKEERPRTDQYLCLPCTDVTGVKQRQGKFEIKSLVAGPRPWAAHGLTGRIDQWVKWSFDDEDIVFREALAGKLNGSGKWAAVEKKRYLQKYSCASGEMKLVSPEDRPPSGCNVELTLIDVDASVSQWLTLGFEAFGEPGDTFKLLHDALDEFFTRCGPPPLPLSGHDSLSYPTWLALLG
jgi:hypothetical protein